MRRKIIYTLVLVPFVFLFARLSPTHAAVLQTCGQWSIVPSPNTGYGELYSVTALSSTDAWAVGTLALHWDGMSWSTVTLPTVGSGSSLSGIAALSSNDIWAVGSYTPNGQIYDQTLAMHWDGSTWTIVPTPLIGTYGSQLEGIVTLASNDVWAVGYEEDANRNLFSVIEHWNGTEWDVITHPQPFSYNDLMSITAISSSDIWAVGTDIEHWNGIQWNEVAPGGLQGVTALSTSNVWGVGNTYNGRNGI